MKSRRFWAVLGWLLMAIASAVLSFEAAPSWIFGLEGMRRGLTVVELNNYDHRLRWRPQRQPDPRLAVIAIDYESVSDPKFGAMPWDRSIHAHLIDQLTQAGAALIVFDISFAYRQNGAESSERQLVEACRRSGKVVLGTFVDVQTRFDPQTGAIQSIPVHHPLPPGLAQAVGGERGIGQAWAQRDLDQGLRMLWLRRSLQGIQGSIDAQMQGVDLLGLAPLAAQRISGQSFLLERSSGPWKAYLGHQALPCWGGAPVALLDFPGRPYPVFSYRDILAGKVAASELKDKVFLVGSTCDIQDSFVVPRNPSNQRGELPGCFAHLMLLDSCLNGRGIHFANPPQPRACSPWLEGWSSALLLGLLSSIAHLRWQLRRALGFGLALGVAYWLFSGVQLVWSGNYYCTWLPLSSLLGLQAWMLLREPARMRRLLAAFVPQEHIESMLHDSAQLAQASQLQDATVLFVDIRDYTVLSEKLPPDQVRRLVSLFHDRLAEVFARNSGYVSDFQGDAQMIAFGVTPPRADHAHCAIQAASELPEAVERLNQEIEKEGVIFKYGVGICSGEVSVGYLQGGGKLQHTVLGDTTNTAARLQGKARDLGVITVVSSTTVERAPQWKSRLGPLAPVELKGKLEAHVIYELLP